MTLPGPNFGLKSAVVCAASEAALQDGNGASRAATSDAPWPADGVSVGSGRGGEPEGVFRARDARETREPRVLRDGEDAGAAEVAAPKVTPVATGKVAPTPTQPGGGRVDATLALRLMAALEEIAACSLSELVGRINAEGRGSATVVQLRSDTMGGRRHWWCAGLLGR